MEQNKQQLDRKTKKTYKSLILWSERNVTAKLRPIYFASISMNCMEIFGGVSQIKESHQVSLSLSKQFRRIMSRAAVLFDGQLSVSVDNWIIWLSSNKVLPALRRLSFDSFVVRLCFETVFFSTLFHVVTLLTSKIGVFAWIDNLMKNYVII